MTDIQPPTQQEVIEVFERYELQLDKIAEKGGSLEEFVSETI
jgi:hypothetical protein